MTRVWRVEHSLRPGEELTICDVCGGAEGAMPIHCPGYMMPSFFSDAIYARSVDFIDGKWFIAADLVLNAQGRELAATIPIEARIREARARRGA